MDNIKRGKLEKACKMIHKVQAKMVVVRALDMSVEETADILVRCPTWVRDWLRHYDEDGLEGLRDLP